MNKELIKRVVIGGAVGLVYGFTKSLITKVLSRRKEKQYSEWWENQRIDPSEEDYLKDGFVTLDADRRMIIDGSTGEVLEDFNEYPDPEKAMTAYMKAVYSCAIADN